MTRNLKLFTIFCFFLLFCLGYTKTVKAYTHPTMSQEQAQAIIDKLIDMNNYPAQGYIQANSGDNNIVSNILQNWSASELASKFNTQAGNISVDFTWDDISILCYKTLSSSTADLLTIKPTLYFYINSKGLSSSSLGNNRIVPSPYQSNNFTELKPIANNTVNYIYMIPSTNNSIYAGKSSNVTVQIFPKFTPILSLDELYITNMNYVLSINTSTKWQYNNVLYVIGEEILTFDNNGNVIESEPIEGDTESSLGYFFYDSSFDNVVEINKLSLENYQNLKEWWYVGNDLTFDYDYYYLNNNEKVSVKQYTDIVQSSNSGDTGKYYFPRINRQQLDNLPNETGFYLDLTVNSGDIVLANQFYSFVTYSSVVDSGATGTITNTSGDVTGNIDLTGIQSALTNEASFENVNISSGDISSSLGFNFETDPYANFWLTFTQGLNSALNTNVRTIQIPFRDKTYTINLDNYTTQEPSALKVFFATISSTFVCLGLLKWIKKTIDEITSGDVDNLLKNNQEERNYEFILGGV